MNTTAKQLINDSIVIDNAFGFEPEIEVTYKWDVLDRYAASGFNYMSISIATDMTSLSNTMHYLAEVSQHIKQNSDKYILVQSCDDILRAKKEGKLGLSFMFQGANPIEKRLDLVDIFKALGVHSMILSYNVRNAVGDGVTENPGAGLSRLGRELVKRMNAVGMLIDLSHTGYNTSMDVMGLTTQPVIFSHSNVHHIHPHPRNLTDDQIKAVAATGGFIGINGNGPILGEDEASVAGYGGVWSVRRRYLPIYCIFS